MENSELILIPGSHMMSHLVAEVELARKLVALDPRISMAILIPRFPMSNDKLDGYVQSLNDELSHDERQRLELLVLPPLDNLPPAWSSTPFILLLEQLMEQYKAVVKDIIKKRRRRTAGIASDMLYTPMIDVAKEMGVPSYVFFTSGANTLSMMFELESLGVDVPAVFAGMPPESTPVKVPGFRNLLPQKMWPVFFFNKMFWGLFKRCATKYRETRGILVNTVMELESDLLLSLSEKQDIPPVYSIGPMLHQGHRKDDDNAVGLSRDPILSWLDAQPVSSVVFLCFGSKGSFGKEQVEEIAAGIERSGHQFLWSLRRQPSPGKASLPPTEYEDFAEVLPEGFLERTAGVGKIIGWAPQIGVLAHPAVGAFVSHCGWNSVLESLWFGVPVVAWPMYAEQKLNAFLLVRELRIAVELRLDYNFDVAERKANMVVTAAEVEVAIRKMMDEEEGAAVRKKVKEMSELAKKALEVGGSSRKSLGSFIEDMIKNNSSSL